jgi:2-hydroxychromene-2-carboxylate isomerase
VSFEAAKESLKANTVEAIAAGAFGAPTMMVEFDHDQKKPAALFLEATVSNKWRFWRK